MRKRDRPKNLFPHVELFRKMFCTTYQIWKIFKFQFSKKKKKKKEKEKEKRKKIIRAQKIKGPISICLPLKNTAETKISNENEFFCKMRKIFKEQNLRCIKNFKNVF